MIRLTLLILLLPVLFSCQKEDEIDEEEKGTVKKVDFPETEAHKMLLSSSNDFSFEIFKEVHNNEDDEDANIFISPLSISMALGMTMNGTAGNTLGEMQSTLGFSSLSQSEINTVYRDLLNTLPTIDAAVQSEIANSIWINDQYQIKQDFIDTNTYYFDAKIRNLDFSDPASKDIINNWVSDRTEGKIKDLIQEVTSSNIMFLVNAVYFLADWKYKFDANDTRPLNFNLENGNTEQVPMMFSDAIDFGYYQDSEAEVVSLPYGVGNFEFTALLPGAGTSIDQFISGLNKGKWENWISNTSTGSGLDLNLPKFEMEYGLSLIKALKAMGMTEAFQPGSADFSRMYPGNLYISSVDHKTYIKLDEEGTEAAAATSVGVSLTSAAPTSVDLNRPFVYVIHEKETGAILFVGKMMNPAL